MQRARLEEESRVLASRLASSPRLMIESSGMDGLTARNWFRIRDRSSGRSFAVKTSQPSDFVGPRFDALLKGFPRVVVFFRLVHLSCMYIRTIHFTQAPLPVLSPPRFFALPPPFAPPSPPLSPSLPPRGAKRRGARGHDMGLGGDDEDCLYVHTT
jgi:hypothetical protein